MSVTQTNQGSRTGGSTASTQPLVPSRRIPHIPLVGLIVIGIALGADLVAHSAVAHDHDGTGAQLSAHLVTFLGMVVVLAGVLVAGLRSTFRR